MKKKCLLIVIMVIITGFYSISFAEDNSPFIMDNGVVRKIVFGPRCNSASCIDEYIKSRHNILKQLSVESPTQRIEAQISFTDYLGEDKVRRMFSPYQDIKIITLNIGWGEQVGGYDLKKDETIDDAIKNIREHHIRFLDTLYESAIEEYNNHQDIHPDSEEALREAEFLSHATELKQVFRKRGVTFYGARIVVTVSTLMEISKLKNVRLVDPLWREEYERDNAIKTRKIAIPISPYEYNQKKY